MLINSAENVIVFASARPELQGGSVLMALLDYLLSDVRPCYP